MQDTAEYICAYCGTPNLAFVDLSAGWQQSYIEDCQICCRPNRLSISIDQDFEIQINSDDQG